jgi:general secretion pathway protein A
MIPFTNSPNPNWLYLTPSLRTTFEMSREMIQDRQGLAFILGDVGMGKTTALRFLHAEYASQEEDFRTTLITLANYPSPFAFLRKICGDFGIDPKRSLALQQDAFEPYLLNEYQEGRTVVVFVDEGQLMTDQVLEVLRGLLNFETHEHKLIQIVVAAQMDLRDRLLSKRNKAIKSRIFAPCQIRRLTAEETAGMISFRCNRAGVLNPFDARGMERVFEITHGVPRSIVVVCKHASSRARREGYDNIVPLEFIDAAASAITLPEPEAEIPQTPLPQSSLEPSTTVV